MGQLDAMLVKMGALPQIYPVQKKLWILSWKQFEEQDTKKKIKIAIDIAASDFCIGTKYDLDSKSPTKSGQNFKTGEDLMELYTQLCKEYPIVSIEEPFDRDDWELTKLLTKDGLCQVVGDDLLMSNTKRVQKAIDEFTCNALLLKLNHIGTVTEVIEAVKLAKDARWGVVMSHTPGETDDSFIADLAVGLVTGQIKAGAPCRGERLSKYNQAVISEKYGATGCNVSEDGGFTPNISSLKEALDLVMEAIERTGYKEKIKIAIDVAASDFCIGTKYDFASKSPTKSGQNFKTGEDLMELYTQLCKEYPIVLIEEPFDRDDWERTKLLTKHGLCQVVGDYLLMSNTKCVQKAIDEFTCSALLLKAIEVVKLAKDARWGVVMSHTPGETEDSFIADLAVGLVTGQIKAGAPCRGERLSKYNQLLRIEQELGHQAMYAGNNWRLP